MLPLTCKVFRDFFTFFLLMYVLKQWDVIFHEQHEAAGDVFALFDAALGVAEVDVDTLICGAAYHNDGFIGPRIGHVVLSRVVQVDDELADGAVVMVVAEEGSVVGLHVLALFQGISALDKGVFEAVEGFFACVVHV